MALISNPTELGFFWQKLQHLASLQRQANTRQSVLDLLSPDKAPQSAGILAGCAPLSHYSLRPSFISTPAVIKLICLLIIDTRNAQS